MPNLSMSDGSRHGRQEIEDVRSSRRDTDTLTTLEKVLRKPRWALNGLHLMANHYDCNGLFRIEQPQAPFKIKCATTTDLEERMGRICVSHNTTQMYVVWEQRMPIPRFKLKETALVNKLKSIWLQ